MNVISISTDRNVFIAGSPVRERMISYGSIFSELHIVVFARSALGLKPEQISDNVWVYPTNSYARFLYMRNAVATAQDIIRKRAWQGKDFVVTCQDPFESGNVGVILKKIYSCPLQLQVHTDFASPYFVKGSPFNKIRVKLARKNVPYADEIRVVSARIRASIESLGTARDIIDIVPIFTDITALKAAEPLDFRKMFPEFACTILMASRLEGEKNLFFALDVFQELLKKFPKAGLIIVGSGSQEAELRKYAAKKGMANSVVFAGWQKNLASWYKSATLFFSTSYYEGYGLSLIEAAVAGAPIVTSNVGIATELLLHGQHARICNGFEAGAYVREMSDMLMHNERRYEMGKRAKEIERELIKDKDEYLVHYRNCLQKAIANHESHI